MRSYSSLLSHILHANPDIDGYGELQIDYASPLDLVTMRRQVMQTTGGPLSGLYVFDKVLHNHIQLHDSVILAPYVTVMIGIREPESTIRSIVAMGQAKKRPDWKADPTKAYRHWSNRVGAAIALAECRKDVIAFPMDALISHSEEFLPELTSTLALSSQLTGDYRPGPLTGKARFGDTSPNIKAGQILADRPAHEVELPEAIVDQAWAEYRRAMERLLNRAETPLCPEAVAQQP